MKLLRSIYHYLFALLGAIVFRFPSRQLYVVGITGTKGKTSTVELVSAILETAGFRTAICSTLRFKIGEEAAPNRLKMTMPGRFFIQRFLRAAVEANCHYAIVEMTSEGAKQFRHRFIAMDALIFTNLAPEHLESHGSYENYLAAKLEIAKQLERSNKPNKLIVVNSDDKVSPKFLNTTVPRKLRYSYAQAEPVKFTDHGTELMVGGEKVTTLLPGRFNVYNILAAAAFAREQAIGWPTIRQAVERLHGIRGRMEEVGLQEFKVIVDYAHTADSLKQVYQTFGSRRKICVLGSCGGGRDTWKRPVMGKIAADHCYRIILTDEDSYDEDPEQIVSQVAAGIRETPYEVVMDRRLAIRRAVAQARAGDVVIITGKGTDPYIMGPKGSKTPWSDAAVAHEELERLKQKKQPA